MIGHKKLFDEICQIYNSGKLPSKILFTGFKGIGKATFAYHFINYILSRNEIFSYQINENFINKNNRSYNLILDGTHPNFYCIKKNEEKRHIDINEIRKLNNFINKSSFNDNLKIVLIDDLETLTYQASNALLKLIEEPNNKVQYILIHDKSKSILETVKSRCITFKFKLDNISLVNIVNNHFKDNVYQTIPEDFTKNLITPLNYINLINFCNQNDIHIADASVEKILKNIVDKKLYRNNNFDIYEIKTYVEILLKKKYSLLKSNNIFRLNNYLNKKFNDIYKFNLDMETFFIELDTKLLNEK